MSVLEKILEEIEEKFKTADAEKCDCEELCDVEDWYDSGYIDGQLSTHEKCMDIIRSHMDEMNNDGWIPVEERLPEEKINPITKDFYVYPVTFELDGVRDIRYYPFGMGHWWKATEIMDEYVKAWMPIPEPYRPKEKNNE